MWRERPQGLVVQSILCIWQTQNLLASSAEVDCWFLQLFGFFCKNTQTSVGEPCTPSSRTLILQLRPHLFPIDTRYFHLQASWTLRLNPLLLAQSLQGFWTAWGRVENCPWRDLRNYIFLLWGWNWECCFWSEIFTCSGYTWQLLHSICPPSFLRSLLTLFLFFPLLWSRRLQLSCQQP